MREPLSPEPVMDADVTFEVHVFREDRWEVIDVFAKREEALAFARDNAERFHAIQVKAEHYDPVRGVYVSNTVFRHGTAKKVEKALPRAVTTRPVKQFVQHMDMPTPSPRPVPKAPSPPSWMDRLRALFAS
jgi:ribosomal protein L25 (general stress protein Ctc)